MGLSDLKPTNMSAFVRGKLTEIEAAIVSGVSHDDVWKALREQGLTLTFNSYMSAVKRARKARGEQPATVQQPTKVKQQTQAAPTGQPSNEPEPEPDSPSRTPRDPYTARKARLEIQKRDYSDLDDDRYK